MAAVAYCGHASISMQASLTLFAPTLDVRLVAIRRPSPVCEDADVAMGYELQSHQIDKLIKIKEATDGAPRAWKSVINCQERR